MIPIPKSGDLNDTSNYRGISLAPIIAKTAKKMMLNRIQAVVDSEAKPEWIQTCSCSHLGINETYRRGEEPH